MRIAVAAAVLAITGCITHLPVRTTTHLQIHWQSSFEAAEREAARVDKPLLAVLAAGEINGLC